MKFKRLNTSHLVCRCKAFLLVLCMLCVFPVDADGASVAPSEAESIEPAIYTIENLVLVKKVLLGIFSDSTADINADGFIDVCDLVRIKKILAGMFIPPQSMQYQEIEPFESGFMTDPVSYYTAYYDVDFHIERMTAEFNGDGNWIELDIKQYNSFTDNACMIDLPYTLLGTTPTVRLRAYYTKSVQKLSGTPTFELDGYRIKATLGDYTEYFTPSATPPVALISASQIVPVDYIKFERTTPFGSKEEFYLAMRPVSTSRFSINGLSPTNFCKVFKASQDRQKRYYVFINSAYGNRNDRGAIQFVDTTDPTSSNYTLWRMILADSITTFNECLNQAGIEAHIEEVPAGQSKNTISYGMVPNNYAGLCQMHSESNCFNIYINNDEYMLSTASEIKATTVHEMGHLLGFNDSAYAENDSVYSYGRDSSRVTYFQPNDIASLRTWIAGKNGQVF